MSEPQGAPTTWMVTVIGLVLLVLAIVGSAVDASTEPPAYVDEVTIELPDSPGDDEVLITLPPSTVGRNVERPYQTTTTQPRTAQDWISHYFPAGEHRDWGMRVAWCESRFEQYAFNPSSGASGIFQHLEKYWRERSVEAGFGGWDIFNVQANVAVAAWLYDDGRGASHWSCS